jgi:phosphoserine phosphatase RsbU/P
VVFSDGISEALSRDGEEFGDARILSCVNSALERTPQALLDTLLGSVRAFTAGAPQNDDVTAMILQYTGASA